MDGLEPRSACMPTGCNRITLPNSKHNQQAMSASPEHHCLAGAQPPTSVLPSLASYPDNQLSSWRSTSGPPTLQHKAMTLCAAAEGGVEVGLQERTRMWHMRCKAACPVAAAAVQAACSEPHRQAISVKVHIRWITMRQWYSRQYVRHSRPAGEQGRRAAACSAWQERLASERANNRSIVNRKRCGVVPATVGVIEAAGVPAPSAVIA